MTSLCCPGTNAAVRRVFSVGNDFWTSEKSRLNIDTLAAALTVKSIFSNFLFRNFQYINRKLYIDKSVRSMEKILVQLSN